MSGKASTKVPASTAFATTVPGTASSLTAKIRAEMVGSESTVNDISDNGYVIRGSLSTITPNGENNPIWRVGENRNITWSSNPSDQGNVQLVYSTTCGTPSYPGGNNIATVNSASSPYTWTVPSGAQSACTRVKIYRVADSVVAVESAADFTVKGALVMTYAPPPTVNVDQQNSSTNITWTTNGSVPNVNVYYQTAASAAGPWTLATVSPITNVNAYSWTVPDAASTTARVRVVGVEDPTATSTNAGDFQIRQSLTITGPGGGSVLRVGGSQTISWTNHGTLSPDPVTLQYSTDGSNYTNIAAAVTGKGAYGAQTYSWTNIPTGARSNTTTVRVKWDSDPTNVVATSAQVTVKPTISVTSPSGGTYAIGGSLPINFSHTGVSGDIFNVLYSTDGGSTYPGTIGTANYNGSSVTGAGFLCTTSASPVSCTWTIPSNITVSNQFKVKMELVGDTTLVQSASTSNSTILGTLTLTYPTASGIVLRVKDKPSITWAKQGITNVKLEYSTDGGSNYNSIVSSTSGTGIVASRVSTQPVLCPTR